MSVHLNSHVRETTTSDFADAWSRQRRTAADILGRLEGGQEGVILADQVGMGKTYVALAVATTYILRSARKEQVVVFVPPRVAEKWVEEWNKFSESVLAPGHGIRCVDSPIRSGEDFLRALDDPPMRRSHLIVVSHSALTANMKDSFVQLALVWYATRGRWGVDIRRGQIAKWSSGQKGLFRDRRFTTGNVNSLLRTRPEHWRDEWLRLTGEELGDEPVPEQLHQVIADIDLDVIRNVISELPHRYSANVGQRLKDTREALNGATQEVWKQVLATAKLHRPLLIVDEAHAMKNDHTRISRLFTPLDGEPGDGALAGIFERILMLTATPFELGHDELIRVLSRLDAIRPLRPKPAEPLMDRLDRLKEVLYHAQETAVTLESSWALLTESDRVAFESWAADKEPHPESSPGVRRAWSDAIFAVRARKTLNAEMRTWIIRHEREHRRDYFTGDRILPNAHNRGEGLTIPESESLPFLLAARAQAVAADERSGAARPLFAYGIASSYEAFLRLDAGEGVLDTDAPEDDQSTDSTVHPVAASAAHWYGQEIESILSSEHKRAVHPKIAATVDRATSLWVSGYKCLIFCWYIKTTSALQDALRARLHDEIVARAATALGTTTSEVGDELDRLANRLLRTDSSSYRQVHDHIHDRFLTATKGSADLADSLTGAAIRSLRTPGYLVRYTYLAPDYGADQLLTGIEGNNRLFRIDGA